MLCKTQVETAAGTGRRGARNVIIDCAGILPPWLQPAGGWWLLVTTGPSRFNFLARLGDTEWKGEAEL